ncbi:hypothetical protein HY734_01735 [Candidatus Uhrbacteria bacterium]|nr:hypothetical protein [Candidatus Uhrbacteria bacterium]
MPTRGSQTRKRTRFFLLLWGLGCSAFFFFWALKQPLLAQSSDSAISVTAGIAETSIAASTAVCGISPGPGCPQEAANKVIEKTRKLALVPLLKATGLTVLVNMATFVLDRLAYDAAMWIATGGEGQTTLFNPAPGDKAWQQFAGDVMGEFVGSLSKPVSDYFDTTFNMCSPTDPTIRLGVQLGLKAAYKPPKPKCDWQAIQTNWSGFVQKAIYQGQEGKDPNAVVLNAVAKSLRPGQNTLSFAVETQLSAHTKAFQKANLKITELFSNNGFKPVVDFVTGSTKTPAGVVEANLKKNVVEKDGKVIDYTFMTASQNADILMSILAHTSSIFVNTLLSEGMKQIYNGLLPSTLIDTDPFDPETASVAGREAAAAKYANIISTQPSTVDNYSVLSEFVICPTAPSVRQTNNCVIDASFAEAVFRSNSALPMTIAQALENGLLHGDWPLYHPDDQTHNQDPFCYTYGYCYGNLVKLRKARIIPIGWELAASSDENQPSSEPVTLRDVVDGFDDCSSDGTLDESHPWCHLIDPNWVLKYPQTQCRASVIGDQVISTLAAARSGDCVDTPSCVSEDENGVCNGYGYCVREKNTWGFQGDACPEAYASCLSFTNTDSNSRGNWLLDTVDFGPCSADNAGCLWERTNKYLDDGGTPDDASDDVYAWLPGDEDYLSASRENDVLAFGADGVPTDRAAYGYDTDDDGVDDASYDVYAFEDRITFNGQVEACSESVAGCSELYPIEDSLSLNVLRNPSFESDDDNDEAADRWTTAGGTSTYTQDATDAFHGSDVHTLDGGTLVQTDIPLQQNRFYTMSFYAKGETSGAAVTAELSLVTSDNEEVDLTGYTTNCAVSGSTVSLEVVDISLEDFESADCAFTTPILEDPRTRLVGTWTFTDASGVILDAVQLEIGENPTDFHEGYNAVSPTTTALRVAPEWLGCIGSASDPADCSQYAAVCSATQAGCELYTPEDGDPAVPAVVSTLDACPEECVGYATYKQETTLYDAEEFPLYFIADTAAACTQEDVGCDAFVNLDSEAAEAYAALRACVTPAMDPGSVFFTWQGSDENGYQLVSYVLLESDLPEETTFTFDGSGEEEEQADKAPCTNWVVTSESNLACDDDLAAIAATSDCDEHADIFTDPDCREFYDSEGYIHYRSYSATVSVDIECTPYRKADAEQADCNASGGFWTTAGECRYFASPTESDACSPTSVGCRSYTGGAGRNATTVYEDLFEDGELSEYYPNAGVSVVVSNESVATDGHSMRVVMRSASSMTTYQTYLDWSDKDAVYDAEDSSTCGDTDGDGASDQDDREITSDGCVIDYGDGRACTVGDGDNNCGVLDGQLVQGKTFLLSFWAKGSGPIRAKFVTQGGTGDSYDLVDPNDGEGDEDQLTLSGSWQLYELGPFDTSDIADFDDTALVSWSAGAGTTFYLDNLELKAVEDNLTLLKDSWVTPSTCDETPAGADAPQYYLGCEAYMDRSDDDAFLYQFSQLCSESVVGCQAFYDTQNGSSPYPQTFQATCYNSTNTDGDSVYAYQVLNAEEDVVSSATDCSVDGETVCTIPAGANQCQFDLEATLPVPFPVHVVMGPEAVFVPGDEAVYLIESDAAACSSASVGCTEVGVPTFSTDRTSVTSFASTYLLNLPDSYTDILCSNEALFCAEWSSTKDGNFYFKDPGDQQCEYRTGVVLEGTAYSGWFRSGTSEFCYWEGTCSGDGLTACDNDATCVLAGLGTCDLEQGSYIQGGDVSGMWQNGDPAYAGWVGVCPAQYDLCTEFVDPLDTSEGENEEGVSYVMLDNDLLDEDKTTSAQRCNGQVGLNAGCVLFNDTLEKSLTYAAGPSYLLSEHADLFFGDDVHSLQSPVSCPDGGSFTLTNKKTVDVCRQRCAYTLPEGGSLHGTMAVEGPTDTTAQETVFFGSSCLMDADCPVAEDALGNDVSGTCTDVAVDADDDSAVDNAYDVDGDGVSDYVFEDDTNRIVKVARDRACAQWLACESSQRSWDERTNSWRTVCESVNLCAEYKVTGDAGSCADPVEDDPVVLDASSYAARDVSWYGLDYAGYAIPNQLPIHFYTQADVNPPRYCATDASGELPEGADGNVVPCEEDTDCTDPTYPTCAEAVPDYRLAYIAGSCEGEDGARCTVGFCEDSGESCNDDDSCDSGESCIVGYCETTDPASSCTVDADCLSGFFCTDSGVCVDAKTGEENTLETCVDVSDCTPQDVDGDGVSDTACVPGAFAKTGACYNQSCLVGTDGNAFVKSRSEVQACRGYPETDAPFSPDLVKQWVDPSGLANGVSDSELISDSTEIDLYIKEGENELDVVPYQFVSGFSGVNTCAPYVRGDGETLAVSDECVCSYDKAEYGNGLARRYYPLSTTVDNMLPGICSGGATPGASCSEDGDCGDTTKGASCVHITRKDSLLGWEGFCVERDTSIQLFGSSATQDRPCLTWLPVDQLEGSTDAYAKYTAAGYPLTDTYVCAETGYYVDLYSTGAKFDGEGNVTGIDYACAATNDLAIDCDYGEYGKNPSKSEYVGCIANVYCPKGYVALLGWCDSSGGTTDSPDAGTLCKEETDGSDVWNSEKNAIKEELFSTQDDCPYFCVPTGSSHMEGDDLGEDCVSDVGEKYGNPITSYGTTTYKVGDLGTDDFDTFKDCVVRGVPLGDESVYDTQWTDEDFDGYSTSGYPYKVTNYPEYGEEPGDEYAYGIAHRAVGSTIGACWGAYKEEGLILLSYGKFCSSDADCPYTDYGETCQKTENVSSGSIRVYLGCYEIAQVASISETDANKAWTNRLWTAQPTPAFTSFEGGDTGDFSDLTVNSDLQMTVYPYDYQASTYPGPAGRALFGEYWDGGTADVRKLREFEYDTWPLPVGACDGTTSISGLIGLTTASPSFVESLCGGYYNYPATAQYVYTADNKAILSDQHLGSHLGVSYEDIDSSSADTFGEDEALAGSVAANVFDTFGNSSVSNPVSITDLATQFFGKIYSLWKYDWTRDGGGAYVKGDLKSLTGFSSYKDGQYDVTTSGDTYGTGFNGGEPSAPQIASVGACFGTECVEGTQGAFSVNGLEAGKIEASGGSKHASVKFFAWANSNQMPLKSVLVNWGDDKRDGAYEQYAWPPRSTSGSTSTQNDNFYKNHRGLKEENRPYCHPDSNGEKEWGLTSATCETSYFSFDHDYSCSENMVSDLQQKGILCDEADDGTGRLIASPCTGGDVPEASGKCVFQPRVHIKDNWGWCTGFCEDGVDGTDGCYDGEGQPSGADECNFKECPSTLLSGSAGDEDCPDFFGGITNPWINFDGVIVLDWQN